MSNVPQVDRPQTMSILVDRFCPPMTCYFANCHDIWTQELDRLLNSAVTERTRIRLESIEWPSIGSLPPSLAAMPKRSFLVLGSQQGPTHDPLSAEGLLGQLQALRDAEVYVAVVGAVSGARRLVCQLAGVVAVVTDLSQCDRLAAAVQKAAGQQRSVLVDWKFRYLNRIPWPAFD